MTPAEVARLLAKVQAYDHRTVGKADVAAWTEALQDVPFDEALFAVARHFRESSTWLMPARVRELVKAGRAEHRQHAAPRALPSRFESDAERAERIRRGAQACRAQLRPPDPEPDKPLTRSEQIHAAAAERAAREARQRRNDPTAAAASFGAALHTIDSRRTHR